MTSSRREREARHARDLRDPAAVVSQWRDASAVDPGLLRSSSRGRFWEVLGEQGLTLLLTREYEHLVLALSVDERGRPSTSFLPLPHPSGLAVDREKGHVHVASTRNPNQLFTLAPVAGMRSGRTVVEVPESPLVPIRTAVFPGDLYLHDLALVGGRLFGNAVGRNAVAALSPEGRFDLVWWPGTLDGERGPRLEKNYLQLNSIAAGPSLRESFFSASVEAPSARRPGHRDFAVDGRGVVFSGKTRQVVARGLTRPHSARLALGRLWVDDSGYGRVGVVEDGRFRPVLSLPGWTRGLAFHGPYGFAGTSQVLDRFHRYAPGLDPDRCACGVHVFEASTGRVLGSVTWPLGNQIFAIEPVPSRLTRGLPFRHPRTRRKNLESRLFGSYVLKEAR